MKIRVTIGDESGYTQTDTLVSKINKVFTAEAAKHISTLVPLLRRGNRGAETRENGTDYIIEIR